MVKKNKNFIIFNGSSDFNVFKIESVFSLSKLSLIFNNWNLLFFKLKRLSGSLKVLNLYSNSFIGYFLNLEKLLLFFKLNSLIFTFNLKLLNISYNGFFLNFNYFYNLNFFLFSNLFIILFFNLLLGVIFSLLYLFIYKLLYILNIFFFKKRYIHKNNKDLVKTINSNRFYCTNVNKDKFWTNKDNIYVYIIYIFIGLCLLIGLFLFFLEITAIPERSVVEEDIQEQLIRDVFSRAGIDEEFMRKKGIEEASKAVTVVEVPKLNGSVIDEESMAKVVVGPKSSGLVIDAGFDPSCDNVFDPSCDNGFGPSVGSGFGPSVGYEFGSSIGNLFGDVSSKELTVVDVNKVTKVSRSVIADVSFIKPSIEILRQVVPADLDIDTKLNTVVIEENVIDVKEVFNEPTDEDIIALYNEVYRNYPYQAELTKPRLEYFKGHILYKEFFESTDVNINRQKAVAFVVIGFIVISFIICVLFGSQGPTDGIGSDFSVGVGVELSDSDKVFEKNRSELWENCDEKGVILGHVNEVRGFSYYLSLRGIDFKEITSDEIDKHFVDYLREVKKDS